MNNKTIEKGGLEEEERRANMREHLYRELRSKRRASLQPGKGGGRREAEEDLRVGLVLNASE